VVLPLLLLGGWLQYRDPSLAAHAIRAALGARFAPSPDVSASSNAASTALEVPDAPTLLQYIHTARAVAETESPAAARERAAMRRGRAQAHEQARARAEKDEAWLRAQTVKRQNDEENKYGL
jgi:hypothetical protein